MLEAATPAWRALWRILLTLVLLAALSAPALQPVTAAPDAPSAALTTKLASGLMLGQVSSMRLASSGNRVAWLADVFTQGFVVMSSTPLVPLTFGSINTQQSPTEFTDTILDYQFTPDASRIILLGDLEVDERYELYSYSVNGLSARTKLNAALPAGGDVTDFVISADGTRVVYRADQTNDEVFDLYSVPADGSAAAVNLTALSGSADVNSKSGSCFGCYIVTTANSLHAVFYVADKNLDEVFELFRVTLSGNTPGTSTVHPAYSGTQDITTIRHNPGSARLVYQANQDNSAVQELYSVEVNTLAAAKISGTMVTNGNIETFAISPNSTRVIYNADQDTNAVNELYSVAIAGGAVTKLSGALASTEDVQDFTISPTSNRVIYRADQDTDGINELYSVPLAGGANVKLGPSGGLPASGDVSSGYQVTQTGDRVVFLADKAFDNAEQLFTAPIDGSAFAVEVSSISSAAETVTDFALSPDGTRIAYRADQDVDNEFELFSSPHASASSVQINRPLPANGDVTPSFGFAADNSRLAYIADELIDGTHQLFSASPATASNATLVSDPLAQKEISDFWLSPEGQRAVYLLDESVDNKFELFSVPTAGGAATKISGTLADSQDVVNTPSFFGQMAATPAVTPDSAQVLFMVNRPNTAFRDLWINGINNSGAPVALNLNTHSVAGFLLSPTANRVVYQAFSNGKDQYFSVPLSGGTPVQLTPSLSGSYFLEFSEITPDGTRLIYQVNHNTSPARAELWSAPLDGASPAVRLDNAATTAQSMEIMAVSANSRYVVFTGDISTDGITELYRVRADGSQAPQKLHPALNANQQISQFALSPNGQYAVFTQQLLSDSTTTVFAARIDTEALQPPYLVSGSLTNLTSVHLLVNRASSQAVLEVTQGAQKRLYATPLHTAAEPVLLGSFSSGILLTPALSPDGARLVYQTNLSNSGLFGIPIGGGSPATLSSSSMMGVSFSPDGARVLYKDGDFNPPETLIFAPTGGGFEANLTGAPGARIMRKTVYTANGLTVVYQGDSEKAGIEELFAVVENRTAQTISFAAIADRTPAQMPFIPSATATSSLSVKILSASPGVCQFSGTQLTLVSIGRCTLVATQDGNATFNPAPPVIRSFDIDFKTHLPLVVKP